MLRQASDYSTEITIHQNKKTITLGACEVVGHRPNQEDALIYDTVGLSNKLSKLKKENREFCMSLLFLMMQMITEKNTECNTTGSCACYATGWYRRGKMHVSTSYVGDSVTFLIVLDAEGQLKHAVACNPNLHNIHNEAEINAIREGKNRQASSLVRLNQRLGWQLALARSIGDTDYEMFGLSHLPETTLVTKNVCNTDEIFMVTVCDGAMEHLARETFSAAMFANEIGLMFQTAFTQKKCSAKELAEMVKDNAVEKNSRDNITVIVVPFTKKSPAMTVGLFDGHGGDAISNFCKDNFISTLQAVLLIYQQLKKSENTEKMKAVVHSILTFDTEHNRLHELQSIITEFRNEMSKTPGLEFAENFLVGISHYYLAQLKKLGVLREESTLPVQIIPLLHVKEMTSQEVKQKAILAELLIYLTKCDLAQQGALSKVKACLSNTFGNPLPVLAEINKVCDEYVDTHKSRRNRFLVRQHPSTEDIIMKSIKELMAVAMNVQGDRQLRSPEVIFQALWEMNAEASRLQPIARPN